MTFLLLAFRFHTTMLDVEICILAGGLSTRMGRDKARLRMGRRTLLGHVRGNAAELGFPIRVLRKDLLPRCGPLGGMYSALKTTCKPAVMFLACDMPFVRVELLRRLLKKFDGQGPLFATAGGVPGFPVILPKSALPTLERLIAERQVSLHHLAAITKARVVRVPAQAVSNVNTPRELLRARNRLISAQEQLVKRR